MKTTSCRVLFLALAILAFACNSRAEGVKQLMPDSTVSAAGLYIDNSAGSVYTRFALINCAPNYRLNIHVSGVGERILFGLQSPQSGLTFNLRKPDGTIALTGTCPNANGQTGYIRYFKQAFVGPFPLTGGYSPLVYTVTSLADTGDYYFEIANASAYSTFIFNYWDFQVVSGLHNPAVPSDTINGRVWSKSWQVYADLGNVVFQPFNGKFFVYSDDGIVTKLVFSNAHIGAATVFCNPYGCYNTGNFIDDRRSVNTNTFITFPGIAQYKVFLNDPDSSKYASGVYGQITGSPSMIADTSYPPCSPNKKIVVNVNKQGILETTIVFPYGSPATNVNFYTNVISGVNEIPWNGLDGIGNAVPSGTLITVTLNYVNGLTNLPIWDQERNPDGYNISLVRPAGSAMMVPMTYWDDSQLVQTGSMCPVAPQSTNLSGCTPGSIPGYPGCHPWGLNQPDCHDKMINTWWYSSASSAIFTATIDSVVIPEVSGPAYVCEGSGSQVYTTRPGMLNYLWSLTPGGIIVSGQGTSVITVIFTSTGTETVVVSFINPNGCIPPKPGIKNITIAPSPGPAGLISGPSLLCRGNAEVVFAVPPVPYALSYIWSLSPGLSLVSGAGTNSITVHIADSSFTGIISVYAMNNCGYGAASPPFILVIQEPATAWAGRGDTLCQGSSFVLSTARAQNYSSLRWSTSGQGYFSDAGALNPLYTPASGDTGRLHLRLVAYALAPCSNDTSELTLVYLVKPSASAGTNALICEGHSYTLTSSSAINYSSLQWKSSGSGTFSDPHFLHPQYIPSIEDIRNATVVLTLNAAPHPPCEAVNDTMQLSVGKAPTASAGTGGVVCGGSRFTVSSAQAANYSRIQWTHNGRGTLAGDTTLRPVYTPAPDETADVILRMQVYGNVPCSDSAVFSELTVTVYTGLAVDAGAEQSIPDSTSTFLSSTVTGGSGSYSYAWSPASLLLDFTVPAPETRQLTADTVFILTVKDRNSICSATDSVR
ncbi:MAG: hypothetical protein WCL03_13730, partial [Bacteroidota bacterium]